MNEILWEETSIDRTISFVTTCLQEHLQPSLEDERIAIPGLYLDAPHPEHYHYVGDPLFIEATMNNEIDSAFVYFVPGSWEQIGARRQCKPGTYVFEQAFEIGVVISHCVTSETPLSRDGRRFTTEDQMTLRNFRLNAGVILTMRRHCDRVDPFTCRPLEKSGQEDSTIEFTDQLKPAYGYATTTWKITQEVHSSGRC